ncbi:MAG: imidazole glycerol phosphate synthase subunit HisH [Phycisphaerae bacterium]|nr:imidazole glycerol phosphate synthase subunit HisH [Phycisphaerae bacterium]
MNQAATEATVAIVDYGLGNLFSIHQACRHVGLAGHITSDAQAFRDADAILLPGVGAFPDAMEALERLGLVEPLKAMVAEGKPLVGICLGLQLLMQKSYEFAETPGLGLIEGTVERFDNPQGPNGTLKVPHVGWNRIDPPATRDWKNTPLEGIPAGTYQYFVHSYHVVPTDENVVLATTRYGDTIFTSSVLRDNVFACQFHPERSGPRGLDIYQNIKRFILQTKEHING